MKKLFLLLISIWFSTGASWAADEVPPPLVPKLAAVPFWTNATIDNVMTYASGKIFREEMTQTARTVDGRYVIFTVQSRFYKQPVSSILTYDEGNSALRMYGFFDDGKGDGILTEGTVVYDFAKKSYTITSSYGDAFKETTTGSDPSTKTTEKTRCIKTVPGS